MEITMIQKRNLWIIIGSVILLSAVLSGFVLLQNSAEDILTQTLETMKTIKDVHAVIELNVDSIERSANATIESWVRHTENGPGAFRIEVLETSEEKATDALAVSDGETLWVYAPSMGQVFVGSADDAKAMLAEKEHEMGSFEGGDFEHPENTEEVVQKLLEYFTAEKAGTEIVADSAAYALKLQPIPEQMPAEYAAVGGFITLWIDKEQSVPLGFEYAGGNFGEISATVLEIDINTGLEDALFTFEISDNVEVVPFADLAPQSITMDEAADSIEFEILTPGELPQGATHVDILEVRGTVVLRYTLPEGGSFSVVQGSSDEAPEQPTEGQPLDVRGVSGTLFVDDDGSQVLLTWREAGLFYYIAGDLSADQALVVAESLK
jgi:outer membrane lipoprotein-sorting protein